MFRIQSVLVALAIVCAAFATAAPVRAQPVAQAMAQAAEYRLGPGDQLKITVFGADRLSGTFPVGSQGSIAFPLLGDIPAQGKTVGEFTASLTNTLKDGYVRDPNISVEVVNYRPFFILGEVSKPGTYPYAASMNIMNAVATAGGFTYRANRKRVFIKRADQIAEQAYDVETAPAIQPGDTVRIAERYF